MPVTVQEARIYPPNKIEPKYLGLFVFPIYSDDKNGVSTSVPYNDVRAAFVSKIPIFAQRFVFHSGVLSETYNCKNVTSFQDKLSFLFENKRVNYNSDGTITETLPDS